MIKFNQYFVTNGKIKVRVHYSIGNRADGRNCVTIYSKEYSTKNFREIFGDLAVNDSDSMIDYFEKSRATIFEDNPIYPYALERAQYFNKKIEDRRKKGK
jgi:hypothetical protein